MIRVALQFVGYARGHGEVLCRGGRFFHTELRKPIHKGTHDWESLKEKDLL